MVLGFRYKTVSQPAQSVVPPRFYSPTENLNNLPISIIAAPLESIWRGRLDMLVIVRSAVDHFERRDAIRLTWGWCHSFQYHTEKVFVSSKGIVVSRL